MNQGKGKKKKPKSIQLPFIEVQQGRKTLLLTAMPARVLVNVTYVAVRRQTDEKGAVQRPLNDKRISKIAAFAVSGGDFPAGMILNWVKQESLSVKGKFLSIQVEPESAQLIDGQHRVAGLEEAIRQNKALAEIDIPVAIYRNLTTQQCADIFLSINREQKPVPPSLAYDLFGIASSHVIDPAAVRAKDIADSLNDEKESPYYRLVKYTGEAPLTGKRAKLGIALSTFVNAIKPLVAEASGVFPSYKVHNLENQAKAISAFFKVLKEWYGDEWLSRDNAFMHAAGITGGIDFFKQHMIPHCAGNKSYSAETIRGAMDLTPDNLIYKKEAERLGGRAMARTVKELLVQRFSPAADREDEIEFD